MTSPSRRKRPTTARGLRPAARTPVEWAAALVLLLAGAAAAQEGLASPYAPRPMPAVPVRVSAAPAPLPPVRATALPVPPAPTVQVPGGVVPVRLQLPGRDEDKTDLQAVVTPPSLDRLARLDSDAKLQERIRQESKDKGRDEEVIFPESPILSRERYVGRKGLWPQRQLVVEPGYVCYGKLFFEDKNAERYGWELGPFQAVLSPMRFFADVALFPMKWGADPCCPKDCSSGHCLPGDPVPFLLYPPEITPSGVGFEVAAILALVAIFP